MTLSNLGFVVLGLGAVWAIRSAWLWKASLDRCDVHTKDPALFRDQAADDRRAILASTLRGPQSKGFHAQLRDQREVDQQELDRQAHVLALKDPRR